VSYFIQQLGDHSGVIDRIPPPSFNGIIARCRRDFKAGYVTPFRSIHRMRAFVLMSALERSRRFATTPRNSNLLRSLCLRRTRSPCRLLQVQPALPNHLPLHLQSNRSFVSLSSNRACAFSHVMCPKVGRCRAIVRLSQLVVRLFWFEVGLTCSLPPPPPIPPSPLPPSTHLANLLPYEPLTRNAQGCHEKLPPPSAPQINLGHSNEPHPTPHSPRYQLLPG
jgi:hypothetical protein